jgi:hypothetical protein
VSAVGVIYTSPPQADRSSVTIIKGMSLGRVFIVFLK